MEPLPPPAADLSAAKRRERRQGVALAIAGVALAIAAISLSIRRTLALGDPHQPAAILLLFVAGLVVHGIGLHRALFAPRADPEGFPRAYRPWITVGLTFVTFAVLAQFGGLVFGMLRSRGG